MKAYVTATAKQAAVILASSLLFFTACKKDNTDDDTSISQDEAVEVMTQGISAESGGLAEQTITAARVAGESARIGCGQSLDTTFSGQNIPGAVITYNYSVHINRQLTCDQGVPQSFSFDLEGQSSYSAPRMSSSDNTTAGFVIGGLQPASSVYTFNQQYERNGTQQSKIRHQRSFSSKLVITSQDILVDKNTMKIISGTASVQFTGSVAGGKTVSYSATLTFLGDRKGLLTLGNGATYNVQW